MDELVIFSIWVLWEISTEGEIKVCMWLREIFSCACLTVLPGPDWVLLTKTNKPLFSPLYYGVVDQLTDLGCDDFDLDSSTIFQVLPAKTVF